MAGTCVGAGTMLPTKMVNLGCLNMYRFVNYKMAPTGTIDKGLPSWGYSIDTVIPVSLATNNALYSAFELSLYISMYRHSLFIEFSGILHREKN